MATQRRAHLVLPEELLEAVDRVAGKRKRSRFVEEAVREKVAREELAEAMRECAGILDLADYPEWKTPEGVSEWVRTLREGDNRRLARKLGGL
ncbi:MAG: CopG family transcriptional regulator [Actinobacteria bacterium]|nr:CopG family transcriptional regulator [Actinomycetota bacterium]